MLGFLWNSSKGNNPTDGAKVQDGNSVATTTKDNSGISTTVTISSTTPTEQISPMPATTTTTPTTTTTTTRRPNDEPSVISLPGRATTWKEAHRAYCVRHGTVRASIRDVLDDTCDEGHEVPWELPRKGTSIISALDCAGAFQQHVDPFPIPTSGTSKASWMSRFVNSIIYAAGNDDIDDTTEWVQEQDDAFLGENGGGSSSSSAPDLNIPIVNFEMMKLALVEVRTIIRQWSTKHSVSHILVGRFDWPQWISSTTTARDAQNSILSTLSTDDMELLLQVLVAMKEAIIISRPNDSGLVDVIVLSPSGMVDQIDPTTNDTIPQNLQVKVSLWDISRIEQRIEKQINEWSNKVADCNSKALQYKRNNQKTLALNQLAKRNVIQQRIDSSSMALVNLEQTKSAIEIAQSNKVLLEHMRASTKVLKDLRLQVPLEEIEDIKDGRQSEYDMLQETHESLSAVGNMAGNIYDDNELLKELESLMDEKECTSGGNQPPPQRPPKIDDTIANLENRLEGLGGLGTPIQDLEERFEIGSLTSGIPSTFGTAL